MNTSNLRSDIYRTISEISPLDDLEEQHIQFVQEWMNSGSEIFRIQKPAVPDIHLVSYFVVVSEDFDQILLVDHKLAGLWLPPGGHVEPNEDPKDTVLREAKEELGIDVEFLLKEPLMLSITKTIGHTTQHTDVSLWYLLKGDPTIHLNYDHQEFHQIRWFTLSEIPFAKSDPQMQRFINKMLNHLALKKS